MELEPQIAIEDLGEDGSLAEDRLLELLGDLARRGGPDESDDGVLDGALRAAHQSLSAGGQRRLAREIWSVLGPRVLEGTLQGHAYRKPRGHAGDFEIIDRMYRQETALAEELIRWDLYYHRQAAARAVRNRKDFLRRVLSGLEIRGGRSTHVLNLASGPCRDFYEYFRQSEFRNVSVDCVDSDFEAVAFALKLNAAFAPQLRFIPASVFHLQPVRSYGLIWSAGLFDYLDDASFVKLLRRCLSWAAPGGEIIVGNFSPANPTRPYMELVTDWRLHHRDADDLIDLADAAGAPPAGTTVESEEAGVNLFLRVRAGERRR